MVEYNYQLEFRIQWPVDYSIHPKTVGGVSRFSGVRND